MAFSSSSESSNRAFIFSFAEEDLKSHELRSRRLNLWTGHCHEMGSVKMEPMEPEEQSVPELDVQPLVGEQVWHYSEDAKGWRRATVEHVEPDGNLSLLCKDWPGWAIRRSKAPEEVRTHLDGRRDCRPSQSGSWKAGRNFPRKTGKARSIVLVSEGAPASTIIKVKNRTVDKKRKACQHKKWFDAPDNHPIHEQLKFSHHINPLVAFRYNGNIPFQVTIGRARSKFHTLRIARLCYLQFEAGASKDEVLKYREGLYGELSE